MSKEPASKAATYESKQKYAEAAIVRIKLENFVTYDSLEFRPGPNLNVIIGPNGTGKSTVVCAICLGLGGKPSVLGRAGSVSDFIKYGKNQTTIEIELNAKQGRNHIIRRTIYRDNKSEWFINERPAKVKEIEELVVEKNNIQVANLCQFLPQEKVAEFAKMDKKELLESTEKAVGGNEMAEIHGKLIDKRKMARDLEKDLNQIKENLTKEEAINSRLEPQVASFLERRKNEESLIWLKRKRSCLIYRQKKDEYEEVKRDVQAVKSELDSLQKEFEPMQTRQKTINDKLEKHKVLINSKNTLIQESTRAIQSVSSKLNETSDRLNEIKTDYSSKETEMRERKTKIRELKTSIELLTNEIDESKDDLVAIQESESRVKEADRKLTDELSALGNKDFEVRQAIKRLHIELSSLDAKLRDMKNVREEKLNKLRQRAPQAYAATMWLEKNRDRFRGLVYEPIVLSINLNVPHAAKYVESLIPFRDLTSMFLFELSDDMHMFLREVRDAQRLAVNTALIPTHNLSDFQPPQSIESLKKYGFKTYVRETLAAPDAILVYLCLYAHIHQVPIGDAETQKNISNVLSHLQDIQRVYTSTHQYSISRSRYSNKTSSSSTAVPEAFWLTSSVSTSEIAQIEDRRSAILAELKKLDQKSLSIADERRQVEKRMDELKTEMNKLGQQRYRIDNMRKKLAAQQKMLNQYETTQVDLVAEAKKILRQLPEMAKKKVLLLNEFGVHASRLVQCNKDKVVAIYADANLLAEKVKLDSQMRTFNAREQELQLNQDRIQIVLKQKREDARQALQAASAMNEVNLEKGLPERPHRIEFDKLPNELERIEAEIYENEAISQAASDIDEGVVEAFNERKKRIEKLRVELEKRQEKINNHASNYETMKNEWITSVENMIREINEKFSSLFQQLRCTGEIELARPDNAEEFSEYGVRIKVSFRKEEQLQELTAWQQSGGEKSVSTMMYMIALQEMTKCPFRVVDEINQGMDPVNERKVFDIIVQNSCKKQFSQYFLLTPKLLPDLSFDERTNVICVFNGPFNLPHTKYDLKKFIENRRRLNEKTK